MTATGTYEAVARFGTPCYVYDEERIVANATRFLSIGYAATAVHFASMANDNPFLLQLLRRLGLGVFVNSEKHLHAVLAAGFRGQQIIYAATGLTAGQMRLARQIGARLHLDSVGQVATYGADELAGLFDVADAHGLRLTGTHVYRGTNIRTPQEMLAGVEAALELSTRFRDLEYAGLGAH